MKTLIAIFCLIFALPAWAEVVQVDAETAIFQGFLAPKAEADIAPMFAPTTRKIILRIDNGNAIGQRALFSYIRDNKISTQIDRPCVGVCAVVFMAGDQRYAVQALEPILVFEPFLFDKTGEKDFTVAMLEFTEHMVNEEIMDMLSGRISGDLSTAVYERHETRSLTTDDAFFYGLATDVIMPMASAEPITTVAQYAPSDNRKPLIIAALFFMLLAGGIAFLRRRQ